MAIPASDSVALLTPGSGSSLEDEFVNGLVQGGAWTFGDGPRVLTWSLNINEETGSHPGTPVPGPGGEWDESPGFAQAVARALKCWSSVANIQFQNVTSGEYYFQSTADIAVTLAGDDLDGPLQNFAGLAHFPDTDYVEGLLSGNGIDRSIYPKPEGDVFFDNDDAPFEFLDAGGAGFTVILHELGHALGLKHPFDDGANERPSFEDLGIGWRDAMRYTVMSYDIANPPYEATGFAATPMPLDILAIQYIYGANMSYRTGDDTYKLGKASFRTIWDAGGEDTLSAASWAVGAQID
jgi:serralysin